MLPPFNDAGDLPEGIHRADWDEIEGRFGKGSERRMRAFVKLLHLYELAERTGRLERFLVFGSFVSTVADPRDVEDSPRESRTLFSHADAEARFGASVFWVREGMLADDLMREFLETWQTKRDGTKRGIVEIRP